MGDSPQRPNPRYKNDNPVSCVNMNGYCCARSEDAGRGVSKAKSGRIWTLHLLLVEALPQRPQQTLKLASHVTLEGGTVAE